MAGERTERATQKRREEARKKGQVARSVEVNSAAVLFATVGALVVVGPRVFQRLEDVVARGLVQSSNTRLATMDGLGETAAWAMRETALAVAPIALAAAVAGFLASVAQVRFRITPQALAPSLRKINPLAGFKRIFGKDGLVEAVKAVLKTGVVAGVVFLAVWPELPELGALVGLPPGQLVGELARMVLGLALRVVAVLAVVAVLDLLWQRRRHEQRIRMSKEEVRQEARQTDLSPEVKRAIRRRQIEQARRRMLAEVPTADVVVVNPTHFAVALRYDGSKPAPELVAKGQDLVAAAIRDVAEEHGVPIVHDAPLARSLHRDVELGHTIPEELFAAVAEVLAFVYRTARRRRMSASRTRASRSAEQAPVRV